MSRLLPLAAALVMTAGVPACTLSPLDLGPDDDVEDDVSETSDAGSARPDGSVHFPLDGGVAPIFDSGSTRPFVPPPVRLTELVSAEATPPPISGGTLSVSSDGMKVVAADPDRDSIYVIDPETAVFQTITLDKGSEPGRVVLDAKSRAHVALRNKSAIVSVDLKTSKVLLQTSVCSHPRGMAFDREHGSILVACASGELVVLASDTHAELSRVFVARDLRDVIITKAGDRFVSRYRSAELLKLSADGKVIARSAPLSSREPRFSFVNGIPDAGVAGRPTPSTGGGVAAPSPIGEPIVEPKGTITSVTMSPALAWKTIAGADGLPLMVHQQSQDDEVVIQQAGGYGGGGMSCDTITHPAVTKYDDKGMPNVGWGTSAPGSIVDVAQSPDGEWLAFAQPGAYLGAKHGTVSIVSARSSALSSSTTPAVDAGISSLPSCIVNPELVFDSQATAVAYDPDGKLYVFSREPAQLSVFESASVDGSFAGLTQTLSLKLSNASVRDTGHELFHADVGTGLSCTSCHGEALDDGHVWNFQDFGPRRTQNIRGGLLSTLPLHWEGDLPTFKNLVDEVMTRRMGGFQVEERYANALASWIDKTPAFKLEQTHTPETDSAVARGKVLFESAEVACSSCHSGSTFTNNLSVDVGTGGKFQVPSLLGLALHAPFMHDGCAATLAERFEPGCGGSAHGKTTQLSEAQLHELISYLETL